MSYSYTKSLEVRWRDSNGRQRSRRFDDEAPAKAFDEAIHDQKVKERKRLDYGQRSGVYPYPTADGTRWRCKVKRSDGTRTNKRGFTIGTRTANRTAGADPNGEFPPISALSGCCNRPNLARHDIGDENPALAQWSRIWMARERRKVQIHDPTKHCYVAARITS
jgi:hypothetical protein